MLSFMLLRCFGVSWLLMTLQSTDWFVRRSAGQSLHVCVCLHFSLPVCECMCLCVQREKEQVKVSALMITFCPHVTNNCDHFFFSR